MRFRKRNDPVEDPIDDVPVQDDVIRLGQFLKLANLVDSGADAKSAIAQGEVRVGGEVELRRGRQLRAGDVVAYAGRRARMVHGDAEVDVPW